MERKGCLRHRPPGPESAAGRKTMRRLERSVSEDPPPRACLCANFRGDPFPVFAFQASHEASSVKEAQVCHHSRRAWFGRLFGRALSGLERHQGDWRLDMDAAF